MNIDEYLWRNRITVNKFSGFVECAPLTISALKRNKRTTSLLIAIKIYETTNTLVSYEEMLSLEDQEALRFWRKERKMEIEKEEE